MTPNPAHATYNRLALLSALLGCLLLSACTTVLQGNSDAPLTLENIPKLNSDYVIGPGDRLQIFVWRNAELSTPMVVRPDGKISTPLIEDLQIAGLTPTQAARLIEEKLSAFVKDAIVTIVMQDFYGPIERQIRVVGEAAKPQAIPYRQGIAALDVMIITGGLTQYAAGNRATIIRTINGKQTIYSLRLADLMKSGDMTANAALAPGDVVLIPQSWF